MVYNRSVCIFRLIGFIMLCNYSYLIQQIQLDVVGNYLRWFVSPGCPIYFHRLTQFMAWVIKYTHVTLQ